MNQHVEVRACVTCGVTKPLTDFRLRKSHSTGEHYRGKVCRACHQAKSSVWRKSNPDKVRQYNANTRAKNPEYDKKRAIEYHFRRKFGITVAERDEMLARQSGKCLICETTKPNGKGWCVDHDHTTLRIRGILCAPCNAFIGLAKERIDVLERAINYIEASNASRHD